jgi:hypothetical protein
MQYMSAILKSNISQNIRSNERMKNIFNVYTKEAML